jgi:predicted ATPase
MSAFVNLAPISDPALVATGIAQALGVTETAGQPILNRLKAYLRDKRLLLVLDNFEHVLDTASLVAELLRAAPGLKALITSRAALHLSGEHEFVVPPLALPNLAHLPSVECMAEYAAVALFLQRAQAATSDFAITVENAAAVAEICVRLDGLPLAIELAAARMKLFAPAALLAQLGRRLVLLTGGPRDVPARQQTLRNTIDWSYNLLSAGEQALFARLGVFVGGCLLESAVAVCNADGDLSLDTLDGVAALVGQSLLQRDAHADGEPRFGMLETIREYALERLVERGKEQALRRRHAAYFLSLAEQAAPELRGSRQKEWLERLARDHDNLRAALAWSRNAPDGVELGLRLCAALMWFWFMHGNYGEARAWLDGALARSEAAADQLSPQVCARATHIAAWAAQNQSDLVRAVTLFEASLALYRQVGDLTGLAEALVDLGTALHLQGDYACAARVKGEGLTLYRELGDSYDIASGLLFLTDTALIEGDFALATAQSLNVSRSCASQLTFNRPLSLRSTIRELLTS